MKFLLSSILLTSLVSTIISPTLGQPKAKETVQSLYDRQIKAMADYKTTTVNTIKENSKKQTLNPNPEFCVNKANAKFLITEGKFKKQLDGCKKPGVTVQAFKTCSDTVFKNYKIEADDIKENTQLCFDTGVEGKK